MIFSLSLVTDTMAKSPSLSTQFHMLKKCSETIISMEVGQKVEVCNLVFRYIGEEDKVFEYCKSSSGFKARSANSKIASVKKGVVTARSEGMTDIIVTKNGQKFVITIFVNEPKYTLSSEYTAVNKYLDTLSRRYPNRASIEGKGSTFLKNVAKLSNMINNYAEKIIIEEGRIPDEEGWIYSNFSAIYLSGTFSSSAGYYLCLENPREYFRLAEMADKYIEKESEKAKDLKIKSASIKPEFLNVYTVKIKLKEPLSRRQVLEAYRDYNPYTYDGDLPTQKSWKSNLKSFYHGNLYRITDSGKERLVYENVYIMGNYGSYVLEGSVQMKKTATYKLYFNVEGASDPKKYCVTFKFDKAMFP